MLFSSIQRQTCDHIVSFSSSSIGMDKLAGGDEYDFSHWSSLPRNPMPSPPSITGSLETQALYAPDPDL